MGQEHEGLFLPAPAVLLRAKLLQSTNRIIASNLSILEDLANEHDEAMAKLRGALPTELKAYVDLADHFTDVKFQTLRTRIIKTCNDARREIEETVEALHLND